MAWFTAKEWKNRLVEFAGRRSLKNVSTNETTVYDVTRNEGRVSQEGDSFSATTMNDLEQRISEGFSAAEEANSQLSSELYQETTETNSMDLVDAVNFICNNLELQKSFRKVFQCLNGWYSLDTIKSSGGVCSGFLSSLTTSEAYSFYKDGADAVLKKLGNATITFKTELHSAGNTGWGITRISKPDGYSSVDAYLSQGFGSVYGYTSSDTDSPYGAILGALTTSKQTFDVSKYVEIGIRVNGNDSNAHTTFY